MKLRSNDLKSIVRVVITGFLDSLIKDEATNESTLAMLEAKKKAMQEQLSFDIDQGKYDFILDSTTQDAAIELTKLLQGIEPFASTKPAELNPDSLDGDELTFTLGGETPNKGTQIVNITNHGDNPTFNAFTQTRKKDKMQMIEDNLKRIIEEGIAYDRLTTYHIQVQHLHEVWNFYLTSEKFHRNGLPEEGRGIEKFIAMIKAPVKK